MCMAAGMNHRLTKALGACGGALDSFQVITKSKQAYVALPQKALHHVKMLWLETALAYVSLLAQP